MYPRETTSRIVLAVILASAGVLRLYHLETPSLWWDEILVPLTSSHGLAYILDFCRSAEMHPPLFYFVNKAVMAVGLDDFILRLPAALLGMASVYMLYRMVRAAVDEDTALLAAAILAVNGLHLLLSREVRPYALQMVLLLTAWSLLLRLATHGRWRDLIGLCLVNATLFWLHYFTFHMVFAQGAVMLCMLAAAHCPVDRKRFAAFVLATLAAATPVFIWFFLPSSGSRSIFSDSQYSRADVLARITDYLGQAAFFFEPAWTRGVAWMVILAGFASLALKKPRLAACCVLLAFIPLANVLALGKAAYFSPWHVAYVTVFLAFFAACALRALPGRKYLAAALAVGGAVFILSGQHARYYETDSYRHNVFVTLYKSMARTLAGMIPSGGLTSCSNPGFANGVNWYLDRYAAPNPLRSQALGPADATASLRFISAFRDYGVLGRDEASFLAAMGRPEMVEPALNATVYTFSIPREPVTPVDGLPFHSALSDSPRDFFRRVNSLSDAVFCPVQGVGVTPSKPGSPARIEYVLENRAGAETARFFVNLEFLNSGAGNYLGLFYAFDDEPKVPLAGSAGPDAKRQVRAIFERGKPFKRLTFSLEMLCRDETAQYHGGNLETLAFRKLDVFACGPEDSASCQEAWEQVYMESLRMNYSAQAFRKPGRVRQKVRLDEAAHVKQAAGEVPGWHVVTPEDAGTTGVVLADVEPADGMVFYPRMSGPGDSIVVSEIGPDGAAKPVFMMRGGDEWTPISAQYPLDLGGGAGKRSLRIELHGRYAQLWVKDGQIFF